VIGSEPGDEYIEFTFLVGPDRTETAKIAWPDDTNDCDEPLVRLVEWNNISFRNWTALDEVLVYFNGEDEYTVVVPPKKEGLVHNLLYTYPSIFTIYTTSEATWGSSVDVLAHIRSSIHILTGSVILGCSLLLGILMFPITPEQIATLNGGAMFTILCLLLALSYKLIETGLRRAFYHEVLE